MRLQDFEVSGEGLETRYTLEVGDVARDHELVITGSPELISEVFRDADLDVTIDPQRGEGWDRQLEAARDEELRLLADFAAFSAGTSTMKTRPEESTPANTVIVSLRRTRGHGTHYGPFVLSNLAVPTGFSLFFGLPPVCSCFGRLQPASGDQDLYLYRAWWWWNVGLASSAHGGTTPDAVSYTIPPLGGVCDWRNLFVPVFQVYGYQGGLCHEFRFEGQS